MSLDIQLKAGNKWVPVIDNKGWWDRINALVNKGSVVIMAAGNGGLNLNTKNGHIHDYGDNGGILVGSCHHKTGERVSSSSYNHGTSLINSWGDWSVATTGYSSLQSDPANQRNYTKNFSGTSSATPLAAGALALIQSYAIQEHGVFLDSDEMRKIISGTGYSEGRKNGIGYRPNVVEAIYKIDQQFS